MSVSEGIIIALTVMAVLQVIHIFVLTGIRKEMRELWRHGHKIKCESKNCDVETVGVMNREGGA